MSHQHKIMLETQGFLGTKKTACSPCGYLRWRYYKLWNIAQGVGLQSAILRITLKSFTLVDEIT